MPMQVYQDEKAEQPRRFKQVAFASGSRGPLTPHAKNNFRSKTNRNSTKNSAHKKNGTSQASSMQDNKENQQSGITNLRRQLRATMTSPVPGNKENEATRQSRQWTAAPTSTQLATTDRSSVLTPSFRHNARRTVLPKPLKTPKSLLKTELAFIDAEDSFLISPAPIDVSPVETSPPSRLISPFEAKPVIHRNHKDEVEKSSISDAVTDVETLGNEDPTGVARHDSRGAIDRAKKRALLRQQRSQRQAIATASKKETGTTPYRTRGIGVQMDLSSMFSEIASPHQETRSLADKTSTPDWKSTTSIPADVPTASLDNLRESLWLDFGDETQNEVGTTRSFAFALVAPANGACVVDIERVPFKKGFDLIVDDGSTELKPTTVSIDAGKRLLMKVLWTPVEEGGVLEVIHLKLTRGRLCITVRGKARSTKLSKASHHRKLQGALTEKDTTSVIDEEGGPMGRAHATSSRTSQPVAVFPKSSPGSGVTNEVQTSKTRIYDEKWAGKQCEAFAGWLNYTFQPSEDKDHEENVLDDKEEGGDAKKTDRAALRTLILHRRMAQVRAKAIDVFHSENMKMVQRSINTEVARHRLKLREDRDMYADLTLREQITSLLLSYSTPWLRLGLETIFGEVISPESPNHFSPQKAGFGTKGLAHKAERIPLSRMKLTLKNFIVNRVLSDPATLTKYTNGLCKVPSGIFEKKFKAEMRILTLRRLLTLIIFLDRAREANILDKIPMLFVKSAKVKSTGEVLITLCRDFLSAEGNIIKHMSRIGLTVSYKQSPIDEIDYTIQNLATDLRDGVRLGRMTEILTCREPKSVLNLLRLPAVSRLQKLYNVGYVLDTLRKDGVTGAGDIVPHHIVDGHREMVLKLMWSVLAHFGLRSLLNAELIQQEILSVIRANATRRPRWKLGLETATPDTVTPQNLADIGQEAFFRSLLLRWCNAVCSCFGRTVSDFTTSFADGTVLCLLIHYYHPGLLPLGRISSTTRHLTLDESNNSEKYAEALLREAQNIQLAQVAMSELGGIPRMISIADSDNPPEEKAMFLSVAYLCSRLMESSKEILACIRIQNCYCRYKRRVELEKKLAAAALILKYWRENKHLYFLNQERMFKGSVLVIERFLLSVKDQLIKMRQQRLREEERVHAATLIQTHVRRAHCERRIQPILEKNRAALKIQCLWRCYDAMIELQCRIIEHDAAVVIQQHWRGFQQRVAYVRNIDFVIFLQANARSYIARSEFRKRIESAISIQRLWRGYWAQLQTQLDFMDVITVQSLARRWLAVQDGDARRRAILAIQRNARRFLAIRAFNAMRLERQQLSRRLSAAVLCQSFIRRHQAIQAVGRKHRENAAATSLQAHWRGLKARGVVQAMIAHEASATRIQALWRRHANYGVYQQKRELAITVQSIYRRLLLQREIRFRENAAAISLQAHWRGAKARILFQVIKDRETSATAIQALWRGHATCTIYQRKRALAITVQSIYRGLLLRREIRFLCACASAIQASWRCYWAKLQYRLDLLDFIVLQSVFRRRSALVEFKRRKAALSTLQSFARMSNALRKIERLRAENVEHHKQHSASVCLQRAVRGHLAAKALKSQMKAIIQCQAYARRHFVLQQKKFAFASAVDIQRIWRGFRANVEYTRARQDVIVLQSLFRRNAARTLSTKCMQSVLCLQRGVRCWLAVRSLSALRGQKEERIRREAMRHKFSATLLQAAFRGHVIRRELQTLAAHATTIQSGWRAFLARLDYEMQLIDVILVQSVVRGWSARTKHKTHKKSILKIQNFIRVCLAKKEMGRLRLIVDEANRELLRLNEAARMIQKTWRCYTVHVDYMLLILSAITIQALFRRRQAVVKSRNIRHGIIALQSLARGVMERAIQQQRESCAILIQARVRAFISESTFRRHILAAVSIQRIARGILTRIDMDLNHFAACEIQRIWRGYQRNVEFIVQVIATITIQSAIRLALAKRKVLDIRRDLFLESIEVRFQERKAITIQRAFRAYVQFRIAVEATCMLQAVARGFLCRRKMLKMDSGIVTLQGIARGRLVRRRCPKQARVIAKRLAVATVRARQNPNMRLGARTASALVVLQNSTRLAEIMNAVTTLETSTRLSRNCCIAFAECNAPEIVYSLVRTCNRSLPHIELLHYVLLTLTNVASHRELLWRVFCDDAVDIFMDLVQMFRDKDNVFNLAVVLLHKAIISNSDLKNRCATSENIKRMKGVHSLYVRKLSLTTPREARTSRRSVGQLDRKQGVHVLQKIIYILENLNIK